MEQALSSFTSQTRQIDAMFSLIAGYRMAAAGCSLKGRSEIPRSLWTSMDIVPDTHTCAQGLRDRRSVANNSNVA